MGMYLHRLPVEAPLGITAHRHCCQWLLLKAFSMGMRRQKRHLWFQNVDRLILLGQLCSTPSGPGLHGGEIFLSSKAWFWRSQKKDGPGALHCHVVKNADVFLKGDSVFKRERELYSFSESLCICRAFSWEI